MKLYSENHKIFVDRLFNLIINYYQERLISLALFGSYARNENRPNSDIDLIIVADFPKEQGRLNRQREFIENVEMSLSTLELELFKVGISTDISSLLLSPAEANRFLPIYLDMVDHVKIFKDQNQFLENRIQKTKVQRQKWGSQKITQGNHWLWDITPHKKWNEVVDYDK